MPKIRILLQALLLLLIAIVATPRYVDAADRWNRPRESFVNWEDPHVHPLELVPGGGLLLAVNTPNNTLMVFSVAGGTPVLQSSIPVGLDPVSVRARSATEAWVVNRISNTVTVVNLSTNQITAVLPTDAEPEDVVFAGTPQQAFVSCQKPSVLDVFNPASLTAAKQTIFLNGKYPRALAVSADGSTVYAAFFQSGNQTTLLTGGKANPFEVDLVRRPEGPYGGQDPPPNSGANFVPPLNPNNPPPPPVSMIVRKNAAGHWMDDNNGDWTIFVSGSLSTLGGVGGRVPGWDMPDQDVAVVNASTFAVTYQSQIMNILMAMAVQPGTGNVTVVGTDSTNQIRFEPVLQGKFIHVNFASFLPGGTNTITDLNPHLTYQTGNIPVAQRQLSIGDPRGIAWSADGTKAWVTGMGSNNVIEISGTGGRLGLVNVGQGPTGIVVNAANNRLYVLNKFDASISVVDGNGMTVLSTVPFFDPTPAAIKIGRPFLYNTQLTSGLGQLSCASCHVDARTDGLAWDLGNPAGTATTMTGIDDSTGQLITVQQPPMKGPFLTTTLQDAMNHPVLHWDGDRPELSRFADAFVTLMGADAPLTTTQIGQFEDFLDTIHIPPNPNRNLDNTYNTNLTVAGPNNGVMVVGNAAAGAQEFEADCRSCHIGDTARNDLIRNGGEFGLGQYRRTPTWRNFNERNGLWFQSATGSIAGFGFQQDGSFDTTQNETRDSNMMAFMYSVNGRFPYTAPGLNETNQSRDTHTAVGTQLFFASATTGTQDAVLTQLVSLAEHSEIGLVAKAQINGVWRGYAYVGDGIFQSDRRAELDTLAQVRALPNVLFTAVPSGSEIRIGIDQDLDGVFDGDQGASAAVAYTPSQTNIALLGTAMQSSTYSGLAQYGAAAAIDGTSSTFSSTDSPDTAPWWQLTLPTTYAVDHINLVNRAGFLSRLRDITVYFYDASGRPIYRSHLLNRDNRLEDPTQLTLNLLNFSNAPIHAASMRILRTPDTFGRAFDIPDNNQDEQNTLTLPEVQVFGAISPADTFSVNNTPRPLPGGTFEDIYETNTFAYDPTGTPWTFQGQSGITGNNSAFTSSNPNAPEGTQALFLQNHGSVSQSVTLAAGSYSLSGFAAQRSGNSTPQTLVLFVDGNAVATYSPQSTAYTTFTTPSFNLTAGAHSFALAGLGINPDGSNAKDSTVFVDDLTIVSTIIIPPSPPVVTAIPAQTSLRGFPASLQVNATDPAGRPLIFTATGIPLGLAINSNTGLISGTVSTSATITNHANVTVSDGTLSTSATFSWTTALSAAPVWKKPSTQTTVRGTAVSLQLNVTDPQGAAMTYVATGLPAGLTINASTGLISGTVLTSAAASNTVNVTISDPARSSTGSFTWNTTAPVATTGLSGSDIGSPTLPGSDSAASGVYTLTSNGSGYGGTQDQFHFVSETFTGNGSITARVTSQTNTSANAQAGVMFRETSAANARFVSMELTPWNGFNFQGRDATGGGTGLATANSFAAPNNWVRIVRSGSSFSGYVSNNGATWTLVGVDTNAMATVVQIGLAVSSNSTSPGTVTFDNVTITH
jgi:DNA-binding beta-propeller fold protein YncE/regulation of enolase protein 1 (concanavalin A-like superfamily)